MTDSAGTTLEQIKWYRCLLNMGNGVLIERGGWYHNHFQTEIVPQLNTVMLLSELAKERIKQIKRRRNSKKGRERREEVERHIYSVNGSL